MQLILPMGVNSLSIRKIKHDMDMYRYGWEKIANVWSNHDLIYIYTAIARFRNHNIPRSALPDT